MIKPRYLKIFFILISIVLINLSYCQDIDNHSNLKRFEKQTFRSTRFINVPTVKSLPKGGFEFNIVHRFGFIDYSEPVLDDFLGLDLSSNIRFGFAIPITKRVYVGVGRTKFNKIYDFEINATLIKQTIDNRQPVTISLYHNTAYMSDDFPEVGGNMFNEDTTIFTYETKHRFRYQTQLSIAHKFNQSISVQLSPTLIYRNLVPSHAYENMIISMPVCARFKVSFSSAIVIETIPVLHNRPQEDYYTPLGISYEIKTTSHAFQITLSNTIQILNQEIYYNTIKNPFQDGIYLGFNLQRFFYTRKS